MRFWGIFFGLVAILSVFSFSPALGVTWDSEHLAGMNVELYAPTTPPLLGGKRALMVSLHGCLQTAQSYKKAGNWEKTADQYGMVVALPTVPNGGVLIGMLGLLRAGSHAHDET